VGLMQALLADDARATVASGSPVAAAAAAALHRAEAEAALGSRCSYRRGDTPSLTRDLGADQALACFSALLVTALYCSALDWRTAASWYSRCTAEGVACWPAV
jgi:hypothetical protein